MRERQFLTNILNFETHHHVSLGISIHDASPARLSPYIKALLAVFLTSFATYKISFCNIKIMLKISVSDPLLIEKTTTTSVSCCMEHSKSYETSQ
jgi:hypothetical protein